MNFFFIMILYKKVKNQSMNPFDVLTLNEKQRPKVSEKQAYEFWGFSRGAPPPRWPPDGFDPKRNFQDPKFRQEESSYHLSAGENQQLVKYPFNESRMFYQNIYTYLVTQIAGQDPTFITQCRKAYRDTRTGINEMLEDQIFRQQIKEILEDQQRFNDYYASKCRVKNKEAYFYLFTVWKAKLLARLNVNDITIATNNQSATH